MQQVRQPYEVLFRWGDDGQLRGAHVRWLDVVKDDDGKAVAMREGPAEYVGVAGHAGYPLSEIMDIVTQSALTDRDQARGEASIAKVERDAALVVATEKTAEAERHLAARDAMRATLAGKIEDMQAALAAEDEARARVAEVAERGT